MSSGTSGSCSNSDYFSQGNVQPPPMPKDQIAVHSNLKITITPKTASVPSGQIITDEFRGTTFWEVCDPSDEEDVVEDEISKFKWSQPFPVEWITT